MSRSAKDICDDLGKIIDERGLSGGEVHMLYRLFCTKLYVAMGQGELDLVKTSLERVIGEQPSADLAEMGKWGPN